MDKEEWRTRIVSSAINVGTYRAEFDYVIDTLASILEKRDKTEEQFARSGSNAVITHTNKGGATNVCKNPLLVAIMDLNAQALAYWRDLGLTPSGLRKLKENALVERKTGLAEALNEIVQGRCS